MKNVIRVLLLLLIAFGLLLAFVPGSFMCTKLLETANGMSVPMACHYTGSCQMILGILAAAAGAVGLFCGRKEGATACGIFAIACGVFSLLVTNVLIGVCANPSMSCRMAGLPAANLLAVLVMAMGALVVIFAQRRRGGEND